MADIRDRMYDKLKAIARDQKTITYKEFAELFGLNYRAHWKYLKDAYNEIDTQEVQHKRPMISAVLIKIRFNRSGTGFYRCAKDLQLFSGDPDNAKDQKYFHGQELEKVYEYWATN